MIVCLCRAVSDRDIKHAIRCGNLTCKDIGKFCRAGTGCGACCKEIKEMVEQEKRKILSEKLDAVQNSLEDLADAVGDLTINDIFDMVLAAAGVEAEREEVQDVEKDDDSGETLQ